MIVDIFLVYHFIKRLVTPFKEWDAYKLGIIDENGKVLKKRKELQTVKERNAWQHFDVMIANLKKLLAKVPGGKSRLASWAAALLLLKEHQNNQNGLITENTEQDLERQLFEIIEQLEKEEIANVAANVAGLGQGPQGEPGLTKRQMSRYKKKNKQQAEPGRKLSFAEMRAEAIDRKCECEDLYEDLIEEESEYQGRKVTLNKPFRTSDGPKKFSVYVKNDKGNVVKVNFGDPNLSIKRDDPERRKSFRARHNCADPGPKWKARYWSCYQWRASSPVAD